MKKQRKSVYYIVQGAIIAALYATLTIMQNVLLPGTASMAVQFRASEILTMLALFTPAAIPGLTIGCVIANISSLSALGPYDLIFGSLASFFAAVAMYALRNVRIKKLAIPAALMPSLMNGLLVGFEIDFFFVNNFAFNFGDFLFQGALVALGELAVLIVLGLPFSYYIEKRHLNKSIEMDLKK